MEGANNYKMEDGIEQADQGPGLEETFVIVSPRTSEWSTAVWSKMVPTSHIGLFKFRLIKMEINWNLVPHIYQVFKSYMWLMATALDSTKLELSHCHQKFCWNSAG